MKISLKNAASSQYMYTLRAVVSPRLEKPLLAG